MTSAESAMLDREQRQWLLALARSTINARLKNEPLPDDPPPSGPLLENRGAFVTLSLDGALRGCIGHVIGSEPLWSSVRSNAINAAFRDPRFSPLTDEEFGSIEIEVSALTPLWTVSSPGEITIGRDGLIIERGIHRGLLLPQVAERYGWTPEEFLDQTCRKAGMAPGCWRKEDAEVSAFSADVFGES